MNLSILSLNRSRISLTRSIFSGSDRSCLVGSEKGQLVILVMPGKIGQRSALAGSHRVMT